MGGVVVGTDDSRAVVRVRRTNPENSRVKSHETLVRKKKIMEIKFDIKKYCSVVGIHEYTRHIYWYHIERFQTNSVITDHSGGFWSNRNISPRVWY